MKIILAIFAIACGAVLFALRDDGLSGDDAMGEVVAAINASGVASSSNPNVPPARAADGSAGPNSLPDRGMDDLLRTASERIDGYHSIAVAVRYQIQLFRSELIGSGLYQQTGQGSERRFRLELRTQLGEEVASRLQVCDGNTLWSYRESSDGAHLERLDLRRVRAAQRQTGNLPPQSPVEELAVGGLPRLMQGLRLNFRTLGAEAGYLGDAAMWAVELEWKPVVLAALVPEQQERILAGKSCDFAELSHLPERVMVFLGHDDLFPRRIEFRRRTEDVSDENRGGVGGGDEFAAAVTVEFTDVQFDQPIDLRQFQYGPAAATDVTDAFLQSRNLPTVR